MRRSLLVPIVPFFTLLIHFLIIILRLQIMFSHILIHTLLILISSRIRFFSFVINECGGDDLDEVTVDRG